MSIAAVIGFLVGFFLVVALIVCVVVIIVILGTKKRPDAPQKMDQGIAEVKPQNLEALAEYVRAQKEAAEAEQRLRDLKKAEMKQKLETFKQTREELKDKLRGQIDAKEWRPLEGVLRTADKGGMGLYILYNQTKDKYYVGQAKQLYKRVRDHFLVEQIARDHLEGDVISVKFLLANELDGEYRLDHIEKTGIEIFKSDKDGYNKTVGNL